MLKNILQKLENRKIRRRKSVAKNVNNSSFSRHALLVYITEPFNQNSRLVIHQNQWQVKELARITGTFGYNVDVIDFTETQGNELEDIYDLIIDIYPRERNVYDGRTKKETKTVSYITGSNPLFSNRAEQERLKELTQRRGSVLQQRRHVEPFDEEKLETSDLVLIMGNKKTFRTYDSFHFKKCSLIPNTGIQVLKLNNNKKDPKKFLFLGGAGQVHKGLDLLLEIFPQTPDLHLYICSRHSQERDFCATYKHELFDTRNIHSMKFMDVTSPRFRDIAEQCAYLILPSCSEGMAGSVLIGMSFGLIPLTSEYAGFNEPDVHIVDVDIEALKASILYFSQKPRSWIRETSEKSRQLTETKYSRKTYSETVHGVFSNFLTRNN